MGFLHLLTYLHPLSFLTCVVWVCYDIHFQIRPGHRTRAVFATMTSDPNESRRIFAVGYLLLASLSAMTVIYYQNTYITSVEFLHIARDHPQSFYPRLYETYGRWMPQMFQMMHLRAWAGEADLPQPEWGYFLWFSQQYFAGLITFAFFLLIQSRVRRLKQITIFAFIWMSMTSLSCAHCLLFYFILITPEGRNQIRYNINWLHKIVGVLAPIQHYAAYYMMFVLNSAIYQKCLLCTMVLPLTVPIISMIVPKKNSFRIRFFSIHEAQNNVFLTSAYASVVLHWASTYIIFYRAVVTDPENPAYRLYLNQSDVHYRLKRLGLPGLLHQDPSLGAMAWDVILSFLSIMIWTAVNRTSVWGMVRCSLLWRIRSWQIPLWDGRDDVVNDGRTRAQMARLGRPVPQQPYSYYTDQEMIEAWELRAAEGRAIAAKRGIPRPIRLTEPPFWWQRTWSSPARPQNVALAFVLGVLGGLGWMSAGVLGAGPEHLTI